MSAYPGPTQTPAIFNTIYFIATDPKAGYQTPWIVNQNTNGFNAFTSPGSSQGFTINPDGNFQVSTPSTATQTLTVGGTDRLRVTNTGLNLFISNTPGATATHYPVFSDNNGLTLINVNKSGMNYVPNTDTLNVGTLTSTTVNTNNVQAASISTTGFLSTNLFSSLYLPTTGTTLDTVPRLVSRDLLTPINGRIYFTYFYPWRTVTITQLCIVCSGTGADIGGTTVRRMGLYTPATANSSALTLVARTANDSTIGASAGLNSYNLDATGGFPTSYTLNAGTQYVFSIILYNTGGSFVPPTIANTQLSTGNLSNQNPRMAYQADTQTDLSTAFTVSTVSNTMVFGRLQ